MPSAFIPSRLGYSAMHLVCNRYTSGQSIPVLSYLARILPFYWMLAIMFVLSSIMRGAGEMMVPMISSLAALWLARVPAAYLLAHFFGPMNIHFCYAIGWALGLAICVPYYFSGRWKEKSIVVRAAGGS